MNYAWPTAEIAVMGAELQKLSLNEINKAERAAKLLEKKQNMQSCLLIPYCSQRGFVDEVILPQDTRRKLIKAHSMLENKVSVTPNRKHGNIPL
jgi:propionyl-CoA carboxylase beta chain